MGTIVQLQGWGHKGKVTTRVRQVTCTLQVCIAATANRTYIFFSTLLPTSTMLWIYKKNKALSSRNNIPFLDAAPRSFFFLLCWRPLPVCVTGTFEALLNGDIAFEEGNPTHGTK